MSQTVEAPEKQASRTDQDFSAEVHVYNDETFPMEKVIRAFCQVLPGVDAQKAHQLTMRIHNEGVATVWGGPREVCELYAEQLNGHGLDARVA